MNEEEGLGEIIKKQDEELLEKYKKQQNPQDPNILEEELKKREKAAEDDDLEENNLLGSRLFDAIDGKINQFSNFVAEAAEDKEGISDDAVRLTLRGLQGIGNLPIIKQIGQLEEGIVGGVRNLAERQDLIDPRAFTYSTRLGLAFAADKGIGKVVKVGKEAAKTRKINQLVRGKNIFGQPLKPITPTPTQELLDSVYGPGGLKGVLMQSINGTPPSGSGFNWAHFGYKVDKSGNTKLPTLVNRAKKTGDLLKEYDVSDALYNYYIELEKYIRTKGTRRGFAKFIDPNTGKVYNPAFRKNRDGTVRFSLSNARLDEARRLRAYKVRNTKDLVYSSQIQKKWKRFKEIDRYNMNQQEVLLASQIMDQKKLELIDLQRALNNPNLTGIQRLAMETRRIDIGNQLQSLKAGTYYGEHGYAISSKVWDYIPLQKRYPNQKIRFQPGDAKNFHLIYEPDSLSLTAGFEPGMRKLHQKFKATKDNFDEVIDDVKIRYPDHVVHVNPNFEVGNAEKIIRIETLDSVRIHNEVMNQMSGTAVASFDWKKMGGRVWTKPEIREWLKSQGILPVGPKKSVKVDPTFKKSKKPPGQTGININPKKK